jgi:hypothetical protein
MAFRAAAVLHQNKTRRAAVLLARRGADWVILKCGGHRTAWVTSPSAWVAGRGVMRRHSEYFELVLVGFVAAFTYLFQPIFEHIFAGAILARLEQYIQISEAEVISRLSEIVIPVAGSILLIWAMYRFLTREITREGARLLRTLAELRTEGVGLRNRGQHLRIGIPEWIEGCGKWTRRVIETIEGISPADAEWFNTLDAVPDPRMPLTGSYNLEQIKAYREHDFYLVKLETLLNKYR